MELTSWRLGRSDSSATPEIVVSTGIERPLETGAIYPFECPPSVKFTEHHEHTCPISKLIRRAPNVQGGLQLVLAPYLNLLASYLDSPGQSMRWE